MSHVPLGITASGCRNDEYKCQEGGTCIPSEWVCDGESDCPGALDEETCKGKT